MKGVAWFWGGIFISFLSYRAAIRNEDSTYGVASGAIIFGGIQAIRGLYNYLKISNLIAKMEKEI